MHSNLTRRHLLQGFAASLVPVALGSRLAEADQNTATAIGPLGASVLPAGVRSTFADEVNGLRMHVLEAGFVSPGRPALLLLHGYPELAYSWRKVMGPLAAAGYHVFAPDVRGYGRTTSTPVAYADDLRPFGSLNKIKDMVALVSAMGHRSVAAVIGHDQGSPLAGWCACARPDIFKAVAMMSAPFGGAPTRPLNTANGSRSARPAPDTIYDDLAKLTPPRKHYQRYYQTREANENMWHPPQGLHAFLRAYYHMKSADWKATVPRRWRREPRASGPSCRATTSWTSTRGWRSRCRPRCRPLRRLRPTAG